MGQHGVEVVEMVQNPQCLDPGADLHRGGAALHGPERSGAHPQALCEYRHGVVAREAPRLEAPPQLRQVVLLFFKI